MRGWLLVGAVYAALYAVFGLFLLSRWDFLAGALTAAGLVMVWGFMGWIDDRRDRMRQGRDDVWQRRTREATR